MSAQTSPVAAGVPKRAAVEPLWVAAAAALAMAAGLAGPFSPQLGTTGLEAVGWPGVAIVALAFVAALTGGLRGGALLLPFGVAGAYLAVAALTGVRGGGAWGYWALLYGGLVAAAHGVVRVALVDIPRDTPAPERVFRQLYPPAAIPFFGLLIWQGLVVGFAVPKGIFPSVIDVVTALRATLPVLLNDAYVTFVKEVLLGFAIGLATGFLVGIAIAFRPFLQRGFLPLAAAFGAVPIVGLAPVLGRAFGVNWESKAAVVVIVTFFPVVLNTVQGLTLIDPLKLELMRAYAARPRDVLLKLRLPNALPYLFNALKLALVISVISVIVAEFLIPGPPEGLGQRISLSARRGAFDVVFAAIAVTSVISIALYGLLSLLERFTTSWHASNREEG